MISWKRKQHSLLLVYRWINSVHVCKPKMESGCISPTFRVTPKGSREGKIFPVGEALSSAPGHLLCMERKAVNYLVRGLERKGLEARQHG